MPQSGLRSCNYGYGRSSESTSPFSAVRPTCRLAGRAFEHEFCTRCPGRLVLTLFSRAVGIGFSSGGWGGVDPFWWSLTLQERRLFRRPVVRRRAHTVHFRRWPQFCRVEALTMTSTTQSVAVRRRAPPPRTAGLISSTARSTAGVGGAAWARFHPGRLAGAEGVP